MPSCCARSAHSLAKKRAAAIKRTNRCSNKAVRDQPQVTLLDSGAFRECDGDARPEEFPTAAPNAPATRNGPRAPAVLGRRIHGQRPDAFTPEPGRKLFNATTCPWATSRLPRRTSRRQTLAEVRSRRANGRRNRGGQFRCQVRRRRPVCREERALVVTTRMSTGKIQQLWTQRLFPQKFVLKLEFRPRPILTAASMSAGPAPVSRYLVAGPYKSLQHYRPGLE